MKGNQNIDKEVLFFRYCSGHATSEEKELIEKLVADSALHAEELKRVKQAAGLQEKIEEMESCNVDTAYSSVNKIIGKIERRRTFIRGLYRAAAILVIPLLTTSLIFGYMAFNKKQADVIYAEIISAPGTVSCVELPDKSKVWLNSNSQLRYPTEFRNMEREVQLDGEGYFEVMSDKKHPFYVATKHGLKVMAYGTKFNVNVYDNIIETSLAEGKVAIMNYNSKVKELHPGEEATYDNATGKLYIQDVNMYERLAWKDGKIIFRNMPLHKVFDQLSRRYNVEIVLHDEHNLSENYSSRRVTFTNETIHQIMSYMEIAAPMEWKVSKPVQNSDSTLTKQRIDVWLKKE
jgi:ferric-dicitrate binding protein FerR (iron transport regulator)